MRWRDTFALAIRELRRRPARCALTVTSVLLAAALLVALLAVVSTARTRVLSQISKGGALAAISVEPYEPNPSQVTLDDPTPGPARVITAADVSALRTLAHVTSVDPVEAAPVMVLPPSLPAYQSSVVSADLSDLSALPITLLAGAPAASGTAEVDVSEGYLQHIGLPQSRAAQILGTDIQVGSQRFTGPYATGESVEVYRWVTEEIVGVVDQQVGTGDVVSWPQLANAEWGWATGAPYGVQSAPYLAVVVVADQLSDVPTVRSEIASIGFTSDASEGLIVSISRYIHVVEIVLTGIGIVALIIAALGIANALFTSVRERRYEIGVMKAIGARDSDVLRIFLAEAAAIGLVGGLLGTAAGIGIAIAIGTQASNYLAEQGLAGVNLAIPWLLPLSGAAGSAVVSLAAGLPAALRAAHLPAREAVAR